MTTVANVPEVLDFEHYEGDDFKWTVVWTAGATQETASPVDLTGWNGQAHLKDSRDGAVVIEMDVFLGADGTIRLSIPRAQLTGLTDGRKRRKFFWDFQMTDTLDFRKTYFAGTFVLVNEVTEDA